MKILVLVIYSPVIMSATPPETGFWSFQIENDLFGTGDDRFYTNGIEIGFTTDEAAPQFLEKITDSLPFYRKGGNSIYGIAFGQTMFTPEDTKKSELIKNDRPYAGWLFVDAGIAHVFEDTGDRQGINGLLLTLGIVGPSSLADETQKEFHRLIGVDIPQGWDNQIHDELGFNISYLQKRRQLIPLDDSKQLEISHHGGITLGNVYTYASTGAMLRWGTHLKNDIGPPSISPGFSGIPAFKPSPAVNWYIYAGIEGRLMGRNIFLDGNTFRDSHSVNKEVFVGDLQFGVAFHFDNVRIAFSNIIRSNEFEEQSDLTRYGAINLTFYTD